jgi:hypothetical protein
MLAGMPVAPELPVGAEAPVVTEVPVVAEVPVAPEAPDVLGVLPALYASASSR